MASFSRGFGPRLLLLVRQQAPSECAMTQARQLLRARFSTARILQKAGRSHRLANKPSPKPKPAAAAPKAASPKPAPKTAQGKAPPILGSATAIPAARPINGYAEQLALKGRTLLYESPSHFWFRAGCFSSAMFCTSYAVYQYWSVILHPLDGLMWWIPHAFGVILVFMAGMGAYFVTGAGRIVRSIEAVPATAVTAAAKQLAGSTTTTGPLYIQVTTRRMAPFMPDKKHLLQPEQVLLPFRMYSVFGGEMGAPGALGQKPMSMAERVRMERAAREAKIAERKYTMDHLMTAPFRDGRKAFSGAWDGIVRSFNRGGFAKIQLGKGEYKLDVTGGWALDGGRAMDRLLPVRPNAIRAR
ncbi:uncharacterized protein B0H64DRAFT_163349 [Chaetomium fimeti]|uniref:Uncharacterized protein n=1 Tax=Chaetomium fimeti TaxID=1854472 RepID=A0AAE0HGD7_9PEZI|nr:hypothetical protein B0H64DRAFT_163349 [Chaetomium fimeti]